MKILDVLFNINHQQQVVEREDKHNLVINIISGEKFIDDTGERYGTAYDMRLHYDCGKQGAYWEPLNAPWEEDNTKKTSDQ
jgi:hypothetical protein